MSATAQAIGVAPTARKATEVSDFGDQIVEQIPHLRRFARGLVRDAVKADDLVQDTLARALAKSDLYREGTNLRAWLFTILRNLFISEVRRYNAGPKLQVVDETMTPPSIPASQTDSLALRELEEGLQRLPEEQRTTLLLIGLEGLTYEEAAIVTDVPTGTVRSRLSRARETLRRYMAGEAEESGDSAKGGLVNVIGD